MDYEKAYKESFGVAKCLHEAGDIITRKQMERLFPQLSESNDERIRKGLIEALKTSKTIGELKFTLPEPTREECIAYLEKQNDVPSRETTLGIWKLGNFWKENQVERDGLTQLQYIQKYLCLGLKNATIDYLKEQKPRKFKLGDKVHWHDDDTNVITITGFRDDAYLTDSAHGPILFCDEDNWERVEQKPAKWSEEDENYLGVIVRLVEQVSG